MNAAARLSPTLSLLALICLSAVPATLNAAAAHTSTTSTPVAAAKVATMEQQCARDEQAVLEAINRVRARHGAPPLRANAALTRAARRHSRDMAEHDYFSHSDARGNDFAQRAGDQGYSYQRIAENLFFAQGAPNAAALAVADWQESPGHRTNLLDPHYTETGMGVWRVGNQIYFTQVFATPLQQTSGQTQTEAE